MQILCEILSAGNDKSTLELCKQALKKDTTNRHAKTEGGDLSRPTSKQRICRQQEMLVGEVLFPQQ